MRGPRFELPGAGLALCLAGCAAMPKASYIASTTPADNRVIASAVSSYLATAYPPGRTTLAIRPIASGSTPLLNELAADLRTQGFAITQTGFGARDTQTVRLIVSRNFGGCVVRLHYGTREASTFLGRDVSGYLQPTSPFVVRDVAQ